MRWRTVGIVEIKAERHRIIDGALQFHRGRDVFKLQLYGAQRRSSDSEEKRAFLPALGADQHDFGPAKMRQSEASKGKGFFQRGCWQMNAAQEFSGRENIGMVAGDKFNHGYFAGLSTARPKCANAFQRCSEGNHRACRERHADISAYGGFIPDFERCQERATTVAEKRGRRPIGWRFFYELIEVDDLASSSNL